jgi:hypothetical protein
MDKEYIDFETYKSEANPEWLLDSAALLYIMKNIIGSGYSSFVQQAGQYGVKVLPADVTAFQGNDMLDVITAEATRRGYTDQFNDIIKNSSIGGVNPEIPQQKIMRWQKMKNSANGYVNDTGGTTGVPIVDATGIQTRNGVFDKVLGTFSDIGKSFINSSPEYKVIAGVITLGVAFVGYKMVKAKSFKFWKKK